MANAIVAQLIGDGVIKGGTGLKFRYGEAMSRVTKDLADGVVKAVSDSTVRSERA